MLVIPNMSIVMVRGWCLQNVRGQREGKGGERERGGVVFNGQVEKGMCVVHRRSTGQSSVG